MKRSIILMLLVSGVLFSKAQTGEQTSEFISKSHIALNKVQKEMMRTNDKTNEAGFKAAIRYQVAAVKYYKENKMKEAFELSYRSRMESLVILKGINVVNSDYFTPAPGEDQLLKQDYKTITLPDSYLSKEEISQIDNLNISEPQKLRELQINLN
jgi:hypothetical protein